jgi:hypothetical protein
VVDRAEGAREAIELEGAYYSDFRGQPKPHPALREERESRLAASRLLRELRLADRKATEESSAERMPDWLADDAESTGYSPDEARTQGGRNELLRRQ